MSAKNPFQEMLEKNPFLSMSDDNPFLAMWKNSPLLTMPEDNPLVKMLKENPAQWMSEDNPFLAMMKDNPFLSPANPFWSMMQNWSEFSPEENPFLEMMDYVPFMSFLASWQEAMTKSWDMWLVTMGSLNWTQNQMENATRKQLNELKAMREDLTKLATEMSKQAAKNQSVILQTLEDAVISEQD